MNKLFLMLLTALFAVNAPAQEKEDWEDDSYWVEETTNDVGFRERRVHGRVKTRRGDARPRLGRINSEQRTALKTRVESKAFWSLGFGPATGANLDGTNGEMLYGASITRHWEADLFGEVRASLTGAFGRKSIGAATIGGAWLFSTSSVSPYLGLEFGGGSAGSQGGGFAGRVVMGTRLFRTSDKQLDLGLSYLAIFTDATPGVGGVHLSLLF